MSDTFVAFLVAFGVVGSFLIIFIPFVRRDINRSAEREAKREAKLKARWEAEEKRLDGEHSMTIACGCGHYVVHHCPGRGKPGGTVELLQRKG